MPRSSRGMTPPFGLAPAFFSDSIVKQPAIARKILKSQTGVIHRPRCLVGVGAAVISLPLTHVRERSAEVAHHLSLAPCGAACLARHAALRRSTCGVFHPGTALVGSGPGDFHPP